MSQHITVGMPLYRGEDYVAEALAALQTQTHREFDVIISVDGGDEASAEACRPFLADSRFRMVVHSERLDWVGNFNWLLQQPMGDFFCYRQHDDTTAPEFFAKLLALAQERPDAAIVYADCQFFGEQAHIEETASIEGDRLSRLRQFIERIKPTAVRGLIRKAAIEQAGPVRIDEFRSNQQVFVWLTKVLRWGSFLRLPEPIYYRRIHTDNYHKQNSRWSNEKKLGDWTTVFTGLLEATLPACSTLEERLFFQHFILDRVCVVRPDQGYWIGPSTIDQSGMFMTKCFERLAQEGNLASWLLPQPVEDRRSRARQRNRQLRAENHGLEHENKALRREVASLRRSRALRLAQGIRRLLSGRPSA